MRTVAEIKQDILALTEAEYADLCRWVLDQDWERWEREFDEDVRAGRLGGLAAEALEAKARGRTHRPVDAQGESTFLAALGGFAGIGAADCPQKLRASESKPQAPFPAFQKRRAILVSPGGRILPSCGRSGRRRFHLVLDGSHAEYDRIVG